MPDSTLRVSVPASGDLVAPGVQIDLTNCDREPIHLPGAIQPYGAMLVLAEPELDVLQISASAELLLGLAPAAALGTTIREALGEALADSVRDMLRDPASHPCSRVHIAVDRVARPFDATLHRSDGVVVLELEPVLTDHALAVDQMAAVMRATVLRLERAESMVGLAQGVAVEMRDLTGFDRVWVYRFHPDWHGEIIGESKKDDIETWIGMHYPASDIPLQARALFLRNWVRVIPDVGFIPSPLVPVENPRTGAPLDLGRSLLRSASPIHVQYLRNMGVTASLVISLIHRGKLWGLISGHHYSGPKRVSAAERSLCEFLAQALSLQIGATDRLDERGYALTIRAHQSRLIELLGTRESAVAALMDGDVTMLDVMAASGGAIVLDGHIARIGATPDESDLAALLDWLRTRSEDLHETVTLSTEYPPAAAYAGIASGLLAVPLARNRRDFLLWFRGEQRQTVRWAGDPRKPVTIAPDGSARLHPRGSFELWEEEARGTSVPWRNVEREAARELRRSLLDLQIRRAEKIAALNEELLVTNARLEESMAELEVQAVELMEQREQREALLESERHARSEAERANRAKADFLAIMSHELRTPLNAIGGYAELMSLGIRGEITTDQRSDLERIQINQRYLLGLINSILNFTKLDAGQVQITATDVAVAPVLEELDALVGPQMRAKSLRFLVKGCSRDVMVRADEEKLRQILINLLTNASKFTPAGGDVSVECAADTEAVAIMVCDTGRGIDPVQLASVFEPFVQIDRHATPSDERGVGLGLAISRGLARAMQGDLRAVSAVGEGATFTLTLPRSGIAT